MFDVDSINSHEYFVYEDLANTLDSGWSNQREPVSTQESACKNDLQIITVTQLHSHVHRIRQHGNSFMETNGACYLRRGCSGANCEDVTIAYKFSRNQTNAAFLGSLLPLLLVKRRCMSKRLIQETLNRYGAAMTATQQAAPLELGEIPAYRCW